MKGYGVVAGLAVGVTVGVAAHGVGASASGYAVGLVLAGVLTAVAGLLGIIVLTFGWALVRAIVRALRLVPEDLRRTLESVAILRRALADPDYRKKVETQADIIRHRNEVTKECE